MRMREREEGERGREKGEQEKRRRSDFKERISGALGGQLECSDQEAVKKAPYKKIEIDW